MDKHSKLFKYDVIDIDIDIDFISDKRNNNYKDSIIWYYTKQMIKNGPM